jgi:hypothetical protein
MSLSETWQTTLPGLNRRTPTASLAGRGSWFRRLAEDTRNLPRYSLKYGVVVLALFGAVQVWQAVGDGPLELFRPLDSAAGLDPLRVSAARCVLAQTGDESRRAALEPALAILDEVHPDAADWVRDRDRRGKLCFTNSLRIGQEQAQHLAKYDAFTHRLTIGRGLFAENDGTIATILCHEYRHARQRLPKTIVYALSFLWARRGDSTLVENDALLFEKEAQEAVFGRLQEL